MSRRTWLPLVVVPVAAALAGGGYLYAPWAEAQPSPGRGPEALVLVTSRSQSPLPGPALTPPEAEAYRRAQAAMLRSELVLNAALRAPAVRDALKGHADPVGWLAARLSATFADGSEVMRVGVAGLPPRAAAAVANAVAEAYLRQAVEHYRAATMEQRRRVEDARAALRQRLEKSHGAVTDLARQAGLPAAECDHRAAVAGLYQERAGLRVAAVGANEKGYAEAITEVEVRIRRAEEQWPRLAAARSEHRSLEAADAALAAELIRLGLESNAPPRVQLLQPASADLPME